MRPSIPIWGFARPSVRLKRILEIGWNSVLSLFLLIENKQKWYIMIHTQTNNRHNNDHSHHDNQDKLNYYNGHNKTTKERRGIFVRQNFLSEFKVYLKEHDDY